MGELRKASLILIELDKLQKIINENKRLVEENPDAIALQLNLTSLEAREMMLLEELRESNKRNALDTFDLDINGMYVENHRISSDILGRILINFQSIIHSIDHSIKEGPAASRGPIPESILSSSRIDAIAMCPASFRLILSSNQPSWFGDSATKTALKRFNELLDCGDNKELIKQETRELGRRTINKYKIFLDMIYKTSGDIKLYDAIKPDGFETRIITKDSARKIWEVISAQESIPDEEISYRGTLKELNLIKFTFQFVIDGSEDVIGGRFDPILTESMKSNLDKPSVGIFRISTKQNEMTEELYKEYTLLHFHK